MKIKTKCSHCGKIYKMSDEYAGQTAQCKQCGNNFVMYPYDEAPQPVQPPVNAPPPQTQVSAAAQSAPALGDEQVFAAPQAQQPPMSQAEQEAIIQNPMPKPGQSAAVTSLWPGDRIREARSIAPPSFMEDPPKPEAAPIKTQTQTVTCPKCKYSADIPPVKGKMRIRCQECGNKFVVKPDPKNKNGVKTEKDPGDKKNSQSLLLPLLVLLLLGTVLLVGPSLFPDIIPKLLPFSF